jgi:hypothetical protein
VLIKPTKKLKKFNKYLVELKRLLSLHSQLKNGENKFLNYWLLTAEVPGDQ